MANTQFNAVAEKARSNDQKCEDKNNKVKCPEIDGRHPERGRFSGEERDLA
jgi:hypothetical protein